MAEELYASCNDNVLPSINTMSMFGLAGAGGTNPIDVFTCYRRAFQNGVTPEQIQRALDDGTISSCIGTDVVVGRRDHVECVHCTHLYDVRNDKCPNCNL